MTKDEILRYIGLCISYKHNNDISPHITKTAEEKEDLLFESAIEFLGKLEKENAELKELDRSYKQLLDKGSITLMKERLKSYKQLTKAKNLLNEFVNWANWQGSKCPSFKSIQDKAEQFLKED